MPARSPSLMIGVNNFVMFSAVLDHLRGPELVPPFSHLPDHVSVPPQYALMTDCLH